MHQADFPVRWGGVGTKYLRYRQQNKCGVINFHESQIGGEVISLEGEASLLASSTGSRSQRASVFRHAEQKTTRTVELQCSRAASSIFPFCRGSAPPAGNAETHTIYLLQLCRTLFFMHRHSFRPLPAARLLISCSV